MAKLTVGDLRKAIEGMADTDPVELDLAHPPEGSDFRLDGFGNYGGTLQISASDREMTGYDDDELDEDEEYEDEDEHPKYEEAAAALSSRGEYQYKGVNIRPAPGDGYTLTGHDRYANLNEALDEVDEFTD